MNKNIVNRHIKLDIIIHHEHMCCTFSTVTDNRPKTKETMEENLHGHYLFDSTCGR